MKNEFNYIFFNWMIDVPANIFIAVQLFTFISHLKANISIKNKGNTQKEYGDVENRLIEDIFASLFSIGVVCFMTFFKPNVIIIFTISVLTLIVDTIFFLRYRYNKSKLYVSIIAGFCFVSVIPFSMIIFKTSEHFM